MAADILMLCFHSLYPKNPPRINHRQANLPTATRKKVSPRGGPLFSLSLPPPTVRQAGPTRPSSPPPPAHPARTHTRSRRERPHPPSMPETSTHHQRASSPSSTTAMSDRGIALTLAYHRTTHQLPTFHLQQAPSNSPMEKWTRARPTMEGRERCAMEHKSREHELNLSRS